MKDYKQRMIDEYNELKERIDKHGLHTNPCKRMCQQYFLKLIAFFLAFCKIKKHDNGAHNDQQHRSEFNNSQFVSEQRNGGCNLQTE